MAGHHGIDLVGEVAEDGEFVLFHELGAAADGGEFVVGVESGGGVAGEVLAATEDAGAAEGVVEGSGELDDLGDVGAVAAAFDGVVGFVVEGDVEDGAQVEVEPEEAEEVAGESAVPGDEVDVAFLAKLLGVGGFVPDFAEAGDAAAFLVDGDDGFDVGDGAEVVEESAKLSRTLDVAGENDEAAGLDSLEEGGGVGVESFAGNADEKSLANHLILDFGFWILDWKGILRG